MFAKHLAKIDKKTFSFSIWDIEKMLPTSIIVGGKTRTSRMYNKCAFIEIDLLKFKEGFGLELVKKEKTSLPTSTLINKRRTYKRVKKILSTEKLVEFLSEH